MDSLPLHRLVGLAGLALLGACAQAAPPVNPIPRPVLSVERLHQWSFAQDTAGWRALNHCSVAARDGALAITVTGFDPYLATETPPLAGPLSVKLRVRSNGGGRGEFFWGTTAAPGFAPQRSAGFALIHDGEWHDYVVALEGLDRQQTISSLRFDPGGGEGLVEVASLELQRGGLHPLEVIQVEAGPERIAVHVTNHDEAPRPARLGDQTATIAPGETAVLALDQPLAAPFESVALRVESPDLPPVERTIYRYAAEPSQTAAVLTGDGFELHLAPGGGWVRRGGATVAVVAPWLSRAGRPVALTPAVGDGAVALRGEGARLTVAVAGDEIRLAWQAEGEVEGPVLRPIGPIEQGLFAGQEFLGRGETSSSDLDIETEERIRFAPPPEQITMPLMSVITDRVAAAMTWTDMSLQPVYAVPNFFDGTDDHRMSLRGAAASARIQIAEPIAEPLGKSLEGQIRWAVEALGGLPALPERPRDEAAQWALALASIDGPLKAADGRNAWGHCAEERWERGPFVDFASTIWRLRGEIVALDNPRPGGAHLRNEAWWFVTGRAQQWLDSVRNEARGLIAAQRDDGLWSYEGTYRRGHFEDTSLGFSAGRAMRLLQIAESIGDEAARAAGLKALEAMLRFRTPRCYQVWELSLHTPDIMGAGHAAHAYIIGYELTGDERYLERAVYWAVTGVPFVYLWSKYPVMAYGTIPVYGATSWRAPNWIGLPVQWCGLTYADALTRLMRHDDSFDWAKLAEGILISGEQQQYPEGPLIGTLPDSFVLAGQVRSGPSINPCALVSLRYRIEAREAGLSLVTDGEHRAVAPFPMRIDADDALVIDAQAGVTYQVVIDGERVVTVESAGEDRVALAP